ncbi:hypothetical protein NN561_012570 [Cricetulus griseus]
MDRYLLLVTWREGTLPSPAGGDSEPGTEAAASPDCTEKQPHLTASTIYHLLKRSINDSSRPDDATFPVPERGEEVEGLARSPMRSLYVHFLCIARDIESKNICTANTSLIHWISFNQKPGMQATNLFERQCVNQMLKEVVKDTLKRHRIPEAHECFSACSQRLFDISKFYLKDLTTSRGLFEEMKKTANNNVTQLLKGKTYGLQVFPYIISKLPSRKTRLH